MLQREHSAILLSIIKLPFVIKTFVLYICKWPLKTGFLVFENSAEFAYFYRLYIQQRAGPAGERLLATEL